MKSPRMVLGLSLLLLLNLHPLNQLFSLKRQIDPEMVQIVDKSLLDEEEDFLFHSGATTMEESTAAPSNTATIPNATDPPTPIHTAWCILDRNNTNSHFRHFPHSLQSLAPCWSFFCRTAAPQCGIYIQHPPRFVWKQMSSWTRQLVEHMGCRIVVQSQPDISRSVIRTGDVQYRVPDRQVLTYAFFEKPEHVQQLQARVLGNTTVTKTKTDAIRIGLLQRIQEHPKHPSRIFLNLPEIRSQLQTAFPDAVVEESDMLHFTLKEQARWWHDKDVVVAAHGAAITNGIFLRNHNTTAATLIEVYPDGFHPSIFYKLMQSVGAHRLAIDEHASVGSGKNSNLMPDPALIVQLVRQALQGYDDGEDPSTNITLQ